MNDFFEKDKKEFQEVEGPMVSDEERYLDEAISFLETGKQKGIFEKDYIPYFNLSQAYFLKGWVHQAISEMQAAIRLAPENKKMQQLLYSMKVSLN